MKIIFLISFLFSGSLFLPSFSHGGVTSPRSTCVPFEAQDSPLTRSYRIYTEKKDLLKDADESYESSNRLKGRLYWNPSLKRYEIPYGDKAVPVSLTFIEALGSHISKALKNGYADATVYADMGHLHLNLNHNAYQKLKSEQTNSADLLEKVLQRRDLKFLYHTAEMFQFKEGDFAKGKLPQDPWKLWRYFTRNFVGSTFPHHPLEVIWSGPQATYNTVRELANNTQAFTFYFSANRSGCLRYSVDGKDQYFDLTMETIPYDLGPTREPSKVKLPFEPH